MSNVNSHIQMPKCVLRNFADEQQTVHYFDFQENAIKIGRAASLNTELGYYSQDTEDYLRDNIETPFGKVMAFLKGISKDDTFSVSDTLFDDVRKFLYSLMSRSPNMLDSVTKSSAFFQFLPKQAQHDYVAVTGIQIAQNRGLFDDWQITFMINDSNTPFVLPQNGIYQFGLRTCEDACLNLPITPKISIVFFPKKHIDKFVDGNMVKLFHFSEDETAQTLNEKAFLSEKVNNKMRVFSNSQEEIQRLERLLEKGESE